MDQSILSIELSCERCCNPPSAPYTHNRITLEKPFDEAVYSARLRISDYPVELLELDSIDMLIGSAHLDAIKVNTSIWQLGPEKLTVGISERVANDA